jgi:hypothetical protein
VRQASPHCAAPKARYPFAENTVSFNVNRFAGSLIFFDALPTAGAVGYAYVIGFANSKPNDS